MCWAPAQGQQLVQLWQVIARQAHPSRAFAVGYAAVEQAQGDRADILRAAAGGFTPNPKLQVRTKLTSPFLLAYGAVWHKSP